jgi:hypothetical protein
MENVFLVVFLACGGALLLGLINPRWVFMRSRVKAFIVFFFAGLISMAVFGNMVQEQERRAMAAGGFAGDSGQRGAGADTAAAEPSLGQFVLRADTGTVALSSSRDLWDRAHVVAEFPSGTEVDLLERVTAKGRERCRVRTNFHPRVAGWVMCESLQ